MRAFLQTFLFQLKLSDYLYPLSKECKCVVREGKGLVILVDIENRRSYAIKFVPI